MAKSKLEKIGKAAFLTGIGAVTVGGLSLLIGLSGQLWGSRGIKNDYKFQYQKKPAAVQHDDRILAPDLYWILLNNNSKIEVGYVTSDDNKRISVHGKGRYSVIETETE